MRKSFVWLVLIGCIALFFIGRQLEWWISETAWQSSMGMVSTSNKQLGAVSKAQDSLLRLDYDLPKNLNFAGEKVPMPYLDNFERLDRELHVNAYWTSNTRLMLKKSQRYFPIIEPILARYGVPDDFKYLAVIESGLSNAISPAGAVGFWQILEETAKEYGLVVNSEVDERYHVEKATHAAAAYLVKAYDRFGSWTLTAAAYNRGMAGLRRAIDSQKADQFYDLWLNDETSRYIFRLLAIKEIFTHPEFYGFSSKIDPNYGPYQLQKVQIDTAIKDLGQWAQQQGMPYRLLKLHNPWLRDQSLQPKLARRDHFILEFPEDWNWKQEVKRPK